MRCHLGAGESPRPTQPAGEVLQFSRRSGRGALRNIGGGAVAEVALKQLRGVDTEKQWDDDNRDEPESADAGATAGKADAPRHPPGRKAQAAASVAAIFDVV